MHSAAAIRTKLDDALRRVNVTDRVVSKRITTVTGGDLLTGRGAVPAFEEEVLDPPPQVVVAAKNFPLVIDGQALSPEAEYLAKVSATALDMADVTNPDLSLIFTNADGVKEELFIIGYQSTFLAGEDISFDLILASKKRAA